MNYNFAFIFLLFIVYSFLGWLFETIVCSIRIKKYVDRGFLIGPFCPIYGFASLGMIFLLDQYLNDPVVLFILAALIATFLEYITSYILEKLFKVRWWDYSHYKFHLNGRIALINSAIFGLLGLLLLYFVNPFYSNSLQMIQSNILNIIALFFVIIITIDLILTTSILFKIRNNTKIMLKDRSDEFNIAVKKQVTTQLIMFKRLINAFPNLEPIDKNKIIDQIKKYLNKKEH